MSKPRIYLDYAATTPLLKEVRDYWYEISGTLFGNPSSTHAEGRASRSFLEEHRRQLAQLLRASSSEIFFTSCGTESNNLILKSAVASLGVRRIISTPTEHSCNIQTFEWLQKNEGVDILYLDVDHFGRIHPDQLETHLKDSGLKTLVSLMHVNNETGTTIDLNLIGNLCRNHGAYFHSDTVQGIGFSKYDLEQTPVDFISGSAHKFYAPKGCGFVYIRGTHRLEPLMHGGSQERNQRAGTENVLGIGSMCYALNICYEQYDARMAAMAERKSHFLNGLKNAFPDLEYNSPEDASAKILNVHFPEFEGSDLFPLMLDIEGLSVSGGSACTSGAEKPSHVISALRPGSGGKAIRFSFAHLTTIEELDRSLEILKKCLDGKF